MFTKRNQRKLEMGENSKKWLLYFIKKTNGGLFFLKINERGFSKSESQTQELKREYFLC